MSIRQSMNKILMASLLMGGGTNRMNSKNMNVTPAEPPIPKGCKMFYFEGFSCIALNQRTANKKYNNFLLKK